VVELAIGLQQTNTASHKQMQEVWE